MGPASCCTEYKPQPAPVGARCGVENTEGDQLTLQQTQAECTELKANLTLTRDKYSTTRVSLIDYRRLLGLESGKSGSAGCRTGKRDYALLQGSLPKQIQALNDAKNAAMVETANTKSALDATNLILGNARMS